MNLFKFLPPLLAACLTTACTTMAYEGSPRPDNEIAKIESDRTLVVTIDGKKVPYSGGNFASFKVLPGAHTLTVTLNDTTTYPRTRYSPAPLPITFFAFAGKTYVTRPHYSCTSWHPGVLEKPDPDLTSK